MQSSPKPKLSQSLQQTYRGYFQTYDHCNIGEITKNELFYVFKQIDPRINQTWLGKIMITQGKEIKQFINYEHFVDILETLRVYALEESLLE